MLSTMPAVKVGKVRTMGISGSGAVVGVESGSNDRQCVPNGFLFKSM